MTHLPIRFVLLMVSIVLGTTAVAQVTPQAAPSNPEESRGALLYTTHCVACHTTQMHWRADKLATDWDSLQFQVRRWQGNAGLQWGDADITEVARYLNNTIYQYPQTANRVGLLFPHKLPPLQPR